MKKGLRFSLFGLWITISTVIVARLWLTHPDSVPRFPESFWIWLIGVYGSKNGEELADLELLVALCLSLVVMLVLSLVVRQFWVYLRKMLIG